MTLIQARAKARRFSRLYSVWYVNEVKPGVFEPWAHCTETSVATFINGVEFE